MQELSAPPVELRQHNQLMGEEGLQLLVERVMVLWVALREETEVQVVQSLQLTVHLCQSAATKARKAAKKKTLIGIGLGKF